MSSHSDRHVSPRMPRFEIEISNEQDGLALDDRELRSVVETLLVRERVVAATVSIAVVDDPTIHELNNRYLEHDYPTDVISFALHDPPPGEPRRTTPRGEGLEIDGEVVVSADTAIRMAAEFAASEAEPHDSELVERSRGRVERRWSAHDELLLYVVHGLLHIVGYDDSTAEERNLMRSREQAVLRERGVEPRYPADDGPHGEVSRAARDLPVGRDEFGEDS